jgi:hypothetical protein
MRRQFLMALASITLPGIAAAFIFLFLAPVLAQDEDCACLYGGLQFSHGACIQSTCEPDESQMCINGTWTTCLDCEAEEVPACIPN